MFFQFHYFTVYDGPNGITVNTEIFMNQEIAHS